MTTKNKDGQIHIRVTEQEKTILKTAAENAGYKNLTKFIIDSTINSLVNLEKEHLNIHTITFWPTVDYSINLRKEFELGNDNKFNSSDRNFKVGGRGINTSILLKELKVKSTAIHYSGGFTGGYLWEELDKRGIEQHWIKGNHTTRINVNINDNKNEWFTLEQQNENIAENAKDKFKTYVKENVFNDHIVTISGSFSEDDTPFVIELIKQLNRKKARVVLNVPTKDIQKILKEVKVELLLLDSNNSKTSLKTKKEITVFMKKFINPSCKSIAFVDSANYSFYLDSETSCAISTKINEVVNHVGLRDAFIAGFISHSDQELKERLTWAGATMKAQSMEIEDVDVKSIIKCRDEVSIEEN